MFSGTTTAQTFLDDITQNLGLYEEFPRAVYRSVLNEAIGRLYTELVREEAEVTASPVDGVISLASLSLPQDNAPLREEDILRIRKGTQQIHRLAPHHFPLVQSEDGNFYTVQNKKILFTPSYTGHTVHVTYLRRPLLYDRNNEARALPIPDEYVPMIRAKLRGEMFKLANEDSLAAKWLGEYNATLPAIAAYCEKARRALS